MSKFIKSIMAFAIVLATSCSMFDDSEIWDHIRDLESRVSRLEELCKEMNTNLTSLEALVKVLESQDLITHVTPVTKDGKVIGYTISFSNSESITIYNGDNGSTPQIGVKQGADGVYYWTLNGEWLTDAEGNRIRALANDGKNGEQGATPTLKIEEDYWYISYDNGGSWVKLDKATGEQGEAGDSMFITVDTSDPYYVVFIMQDGSLMKIPTWYAFDELQKMCIETNVNVKALQQIIAALENNDYIKSITPLVENGVEIGYVITFSQSGKVTIYHGKNGKDGADGKDGVDGTDGKDGQDGEDGKDGKDGVDGVAPVIGVKLDTDNIYYWTLNGEWLTDEAGNKIRVTGEDGKDGADGKDGVDGTDGQDGKDGQDGADGKDGVDGADGKDAVTPQFKIQYGYWYISYDNGSTWKQLGQATGSNGYDGQDGQDGKDGIIVDVIDSASEVIFILGDGSSITVPKSESNHTENDIIRFEDPLVKSICVANWDTNGDGELSYGEASEVWSLNEQFRDQPIESFNEFQYFTNVSHIACEFESCEELKRITLPNSIEYLWHTFCDCNSLPSIYLPDSIEDFGDANSFERCSNLTAFYGKFASTDNRCLIADGTLVSFAPAGLTYYEIPNGVSKIGPYAFWDCYELEEIIIPDSITSIGEYAFGYTNISLDHIPSNLETIGANAFIGCNSINEVNLPSSVIGIGARAFDSCGNLKSATIPNSVIEFGDNIFNDCRKLSAFYGDYASDDNRCLIINSTLNSFAPYGLESYTIPERVTHIGPYAFYYSTFTSVTLHDQIKSIGGHAFGNNSQIESITIPENVTIIESYTFSGCHNLTKIIFEGDISTIRSYAFQGCKNLKSISLPPTLTVLEHGAFRSCPLLESVYCPATVPPTAKNWSKYQSHAFEGNAAGRKIYVPAESVEAYKSADGWSYYADAIEGMNF